MDINEKLKNKIKFKIAMLEIDKEEKPKGINKKAIVAVCAIIILSTGGVYAKDIEKYFKSLFTNSTEAIDKAVENGYVQKEEMDYVYDKDIGVKVDNLVVDDLNLAISFSFESKKENIKSIRFNNFTITNDNNKIVYRSEFKSAETLDELPLYNSVNWMNSQEKLTDTIFTDSIIIGLRPEAEEFKELYFDIESINLTYTDDTIETVEGNWKFNITINEEMRNSTQIIYTLYEENEYVESATATLSPTGMFVELQLKEPIDYDSMHEKARRGEITLEETYNFILKCNNQKFMPGLRTGGVYRDPDGTIDATVEYETISSFDEFDEFEIYIISFDTTIKFIREDG